MTSNLVKIKEKFEKNNVLAKIEELLARPDLSIKRLTADFPEGRGLRPFSILEVTKKDDSTGTIEIAPVENENRILASKIEFFKFVTGYDSIYSPEEKVVEIGLSSFGTRNTTRCLDILGLKMKVIPKEKSITDLGRVNFPEKFEDLSLSFGKASEEFTFLVGSPIFNELKESYSIVISDFPLLQHDEIKSFIDKQIGAFLFSIFRGNGISIYPSYREFSLEENPIPTHAKIDLKSPFLKVDHQPLQLYWYAKGSGRAPLLMFQAFYQILEFYFPHFSCLEAKSQIRLILKDPSFSTNNDDNLLKIIRSAGNASPQKPEKDMLLATIENGVPFEDLKEFLEKTEGLHSFLSSKDAKDIGEPNLRQNLHDKEILKDIAFRIYFIRCRIVHSKDFNEKASPLLPFSNESRNLINDLKLIEFLATKILISQGK